MTFEEINEILRRLKRIKINDKEGYIEHAAKIYSDCIDGEEYNYYRLVVEVNTKWEAIVNYYRGETTIARETIARLIIDESDIDFKKNEYPFTKLEHFLKTENLEIDVDIVHETLREILKDYLNGSLLANKTRQR